MPQYGQADIGFILVDGYSLAGNIISLSESTEAVTEQTDTLGDAWVEMSGVGVSRMTLDMDGFYDDAALASNAALVGSIGSARLVLISIAGNTKGKTAIGFQGPIEGGYTRTATRGQLHKAKATWVGSGQKTDLVIIAPLATKTTSSSADAASLDTGVTTSANGGIFHVELTAFTPGDGTNIIIRWRDSADNSSFANITGSALTFTTAPSAQRAVVAGTIRRYWSAGWAFDGTTGISATFVVAAYRNP